MQCFYLIFKFKKFNNKNPVILILNTSVFDLNIYMVETTSLLLRLFHEKLFVIRNIRRENI